MRFHSNMQVCEFMVRKLRNVTSGTLSCLSELELKLSAKESKRTVEGVRKVAKILEW